MLNPITTLTASAIAKLAFQEFIKSGSSELAKKFTEAAIAKMKDLRTLIWNKLHGNVDAESALESVQNGSEEDIDDLVTYLKAAMKKDPSFADQVQILAQDINAGKLLDESSMTQNNYDNSRGWQTNVKGGTAYIGEIHQNYGSVPHSEQK